MVKQPDAAKKQRGPRAHSLMSYRYLRSYLWYHVVYKQEEPPNIDVGLASRKDILAVRNQKQIRYNCEGYEEVVRRLAPCSESWDRKSWADDKVLFRCLKESFGIDYMKCASEYDRLVVLLLAKWYFKLEDILQYVVQIKKLPYSLVEVIWPENTKEEVVKLFLTAFAKAKCVEGRNKNRHRVHKTTFTYATLRQSWLYDQIMVWVNAGDLEEKEMKKAKKEVFELSMIQ